MRPLWKESAGKIRLFTDAALKMCDEAIVEASGDQIATLLLERIKEGLLKLRLANDRPVVGRRVQMGIAQIQMEGHLSMLAVHEAGGRANVS